AIVGTAKPSQRAILQRNGPKLDQQLLANLTCRQVRAQQRPGGQRSGRNNEQRHNDPAESSGQSTLQLRNRHRWYSRRMSLLGDTIVAKDLPHLLRRNRDVDVAHAQMRERVDDDGIDDRWWR